MSIGRTYDPNKRLQSQRVPVLTSRFPILFPGLQQALLLKTRTSPETANSQLIHHKLCNRPKGIDIVLAPEYAIQGRKGPLEEEDLEELTRIYTKSSRGVGLFIPGTIVWSDGKHLYNTALVFSDGQYLGRHDKTPDMGDEVLAKKSKKPRLIAAAAEKLHRFTVKGVKIGLEICSENGTLQELGTKNLDLGILLM